MMSALTLSAPPSSSPPSATAPQSAPSWNTTHPAASLEWEPRSAPAAAPRSPPRARFLARASCRPPRHPHHLLHPPKLLLRLRQLPAERLHPLRREALLLDEPGAGFVRDGERARRYGLRMRFWRHCRRRLRHRPQRLAALFLDAFRTCLQARTRRRTFHRKVRKRLLVGAAPAATHV